MRTQVGRLTCWNLAYMYVHRSAGLGWVLEQDRRVICICWGSIFLHGVEQSLVYGFNCT